MSSTLTSTQPALELRPVATRADWEAFIDLPWTIDRGDPNWVAPLRLEIHRMFDATKNPFLRHATVHPLLVWRGVACVGRVVGIIDREYNAFHGELAAGFGFFEAVDDQAVADQLLDEVAHWARSQGMTRLWGPLNPSTNHECGLLVQGFDDPANVMMTYNPAYYAPLLERWGMQKAKDLLAFEIDSRQVTFSPKLLAQAERLRRRAGVTFRPVRMRDFDREVELVRTLYNDAWSANWGFVPLDAAEFRHLAQSLRPFIDPEIFLIVEVRGEPAGFVFMLPDVNQAIAHVRTGRLFPTGLLTLLWHLRGPGRRRTINRLRIIALGIRRAYRELALGPLLYAECFARGPARGYPIGEASWILEDNGPMIRALAHMGARHTKTYRLYERIL